MIILRAIRFVKKYFKNKRAVILFFLLLSFSFWKWERERLVSLKLVDASGSDYILTLPAIDKKRLDYLFRQLFVFDACAYTVLGSKPMSFALYLKPFTLSNSDFSFFFYSILPDNIKLYLGWKTWLKYQDQLLTNPNLLIWSEKCQWIDSADLIIVVNKREMEAIVNRHAEDFQQVLQEHVASVDKLLARIPEIPLFQGVLKSHEGLIGTLLGFGRDNAWLYWRRSLGEKVTLSSVWGSEATEFISHRPGLWGMLFEDWKMPEDLFYPNFVADIDSEETARLKNEYRKNKEKIVRTYQGKDLLETTLCLLKNDSQGFR